jgi:predicted small lipoprotein YifL
MPGTRALIAILSVSLSLLAACGQRGPLVLPTPGPAPAAADDGAQPAAERPGSEKRR